MADRTRAVTRLRETLLVLFPALERALNLNSAGPLELVARYHSADAVRRAGRKRIAAYLKKRGVAKADALAEKVVAAAKGQRVPRCPRKTSPLPSSPSSPQRCSPLRDASTPSTGNWSGASTRVPRLGFSPASQAWGRYSERSSWWLWATSRPSLAPTGSQPTQVWCRLCPRLR